MDHYVAMLVGGALALLWLAISGRAKAKTEVKQNRAQVDALTTRLEIEHAVSAAPDLAAAARASGLVRKARK